VQAILILQFVEEAVTQDENGSLSPFHPESRPSSTSCSTRIA
jgi:hypothetical protein